MKHGHKIINGFKKNCTTWAHYKKVMFPSSGEISNLDAKVHR